MATPDPFEARVKARLEYEQTELAARIDALTERRADLLAALTEAREASQRKIDKVLNLIDGSKAVNDDDEAGALGGIADYKTAMSRYITLHREDIEARKALVKLGTGAELKRRIKQAKEYDPASDEPLTQRAAVELVMVRNGRPMHYREITRIGLQTGLLRTEGETPEATVSAMLARATAKGDTFVKVGPGVFGLQEVR